ncbi:phage tail protein [Acetobacter estunensis]|uniref:phage tail protein n=1 Tax=Acetobacter estunensis TaxID=104097 RepID=UPI001C2D3C63|nr:phage tail protein [Acetobacter estunensis]MBV1835659.1 phage tail protein [Acetobacter estunensis]MBV1836080.1 phage tail protein [Acetobacter estunensis]
MANSGVKVTISAVDRASMTLERINARIAAIQAPVRRLQAAFGRFASVTGLRYLRTGLDGVRRVATGAFRSLGQIVPVLGTITGATTVAGIYRLTSAWAQMGTQLRTTARSMGMAPARLMAMQNAARLSGGSANAMTDALGNLANTGWEAAHGFAPEAVVQFKALGVSLEELQKLSPDALFERVAKRLRAIRDPAARTIAATKIFGGAAAGLLPIFQQTDEAFRQNIRQAERLGLINKQGADAAARLQQAQVGLQEAVEGFGYSVAQSLEPVITPVIAQMRDWIAANREWISQDIARYVGQFVTWLRTGGWDTIKTDIRGVYDEVLRVVDGLGGWKRTGEIALGAIAAIYAAPVIAGVMSLTGGVLALGAAFASVARNAAAANVAVNAGSASGALSFLGRAGLAGAAGYAANAGLNAGDPNDRTGSWMDRNVPGASYLDNLASHVGLGRSYAEQARVETGAPYNAGMLLRDTGANQGQFDIFRNSIAGIEGNDYSKMGGWRGRMAGRYQMSPTAIAETARYLGVTAPTQAQFLSNPNMQDRFFEAYSDLEHRYLMAHSAVYRNSNPGQRLAYLGYAHNAGMGAAANWLEHGGPARRDSNGTSAALYTDTITSNLSAGGPPLSVPTRPSADTDGLAATIGKLRLAIDIDHRNAPPGSRVSVKSGSPQLAVHTTQQVRAMDPANTSTGN